jgi:putative ABC transport system permease protein
VSVPDEEEMAEPSSAGVRPVPFALRLVAYRKSRVAVAAAGIGFAILVIFAQLGFYGAVIGTAVAVTSRFDAELVLVSPGFVHLAETGTIPRGRLFQVLANPEVAAAIPIYFRYAGWRDPETGEGCRLFALGFPLADARQSLPIDLPGVAEQLDALSTTGTLLLDRLTQDECGPAAESGVVEVNNRAARVAGSFALGVGFLADGAMIVSDDSFSRFFSRHPLDRPHLGLVKLVPGADADRVADELRRLLPMDVRVITADDLEEMQIQHWVENTAVGNVFGMGAVAGFFVGVVVLFQILSTDIRNHLPLYATLRAMGYSSRRLSRYVVEQAWIFAALGYGPALVISLFLFPLVHGLTRLPIHMTFGLAAAVAVLSLGMCSVAALLSVRRLRMADPAELF